MRRNLRFYLGIISFVILGMFLFSLVVFCGGSGRPFLQGINFGGLDYIAVISGIAWILLSLYVKTTMVSNKKMPILNLLGFVAWALMLFIIFLGDDASAGITPYCVVPYLPGLSFIFGWPMIDLFDALLSSKN